MRDKYNSATNRRAHKQTNKQTNAGAEVEAVTVAAAAAAAKANDIKPKLVLRNCADECERFGEVGRAVGRNFFGN